MKLNLIPLLFLSLTLCLSSVVKAQENDSETIKSEPPSQAPSYDNAIVGTLKNHSLGLGIGQTFLIGDFSDHGEDKITLDLFYTYSASYSFDFVVNLHYSTHEMRNQEISIPGIAFAVKAKAFQFDQFTPYILGGLGFYRPQATRVQNNMTQETESKFTFGTNLGVGFDLRLNDKVSFGLLFHYHNPFDVDQDLGEPLEGSYSKLMIVSSYTF